MVLGGSSGVRGRGGGREGVKYKKHFAWSNFAAGWVRKQQLPMPNLNFKGTLGEKAVHFGQ